MTATKPTARDRSGEAFEALGDANRRAIVQLLGERGRSVQELADALPISRPAVSRHLRILKGAGLVTEQPRGAQRIYRLHDQGVEAVHAYLQKVWGGAARFRMLAGGPDWREANRSGWSSLLPHFTAACELTLGA